LGCSDRCLIEVPKKESIHYLDVIRFKGAFVGVMYSTSIYLRNQIYSWYDKYKYPTFYASALSGESSGASHSRGVGMHTSKEV
jgi:hypothetical protein